MQTTWTDQGIFTNEYPRPLLKRDNWQNLNGLWDYCINKSENKPSEYEGKIRVPFCPESQLSGVNRILQPDEYLWYHLLFKTDKKGNSKTILHFGAVDYQCDVFLNDHYIGSHLGGYFPFSFDISQYLYEEENELMVKVKDPTDTRSQARGKQVLEPKYINYTSVSGIWQTVWLEKVPENYIEKIEVNTDLAGEVSIKILSQTNHPCEILIKDKEGKEVICEKCTSNNLVNINITDPLKWSPEDPNLYTLSIEMGNDHVESYFAFRKVEIKADENDIIMFFLNDKPYFQFGPLDQGYWPEGIYTAPCDKAIYEELKTIKDLGFNMIRKHAKIEPQYWYYCCDKLGIIVWQDIVNGGSPLISDIPVLMEMNEKLLNNNGSADDDAIAYEKIGRKEKADRDQFENEIKTTVAILKDHPCICLWILFNESWGQFDSIRLTKMLKELDPSRIVDSTSGWADQGTGDILSYHTYLKEFSVPNNLNKQIRDRAWTMSECGGFTFPVEGHLYSKEQFGYTEINSEEELEKAYEKFVGETLSLLKKKGCSGIVYTQLSDVEQEVNGLFTYDRKVTKIKEESIKKINMLLIAEE